MTAQITSKKFTSKLATAKKDTAKKDTPEQVTSNEKFSRITSQDYLEKLLQEKSSSEYIITSEHISKKSGVKHTYVRQAINDIEVYGTESGLHTDSAGKTIIAHVNFVENISSSLKNASGSITAEQAIMSVAQKMGYSVTNLQAKESLSGSNKKGLFNDAGISGRDIPVRQMYYYRDGIGTQLVWELSVMEKNSPDWWNFRVDASNGTIIDKDNWTVECASGASPMSSDCVENPSEKSISTKHDNVHIASENSIMAVGSYNVFPYPVESPNHGSRSVVTNPDDANASPFGWHDTDGAAGPEFNTTRGNNVLAQEDVNGDNGTGTQADGGGSLNFDFPLDLSQAPLVYQKAALTNLFYWNNIIHDVCYQYGFDEVSGNFQQNNYGNGADGNDYVLADAQDGSGRNNANFGTPPDGFNPRMQMFLWSDVVSVALNVDIPTPLAGTYSGVQAGFGPAFSVTPLVNDFALFDDGTAPDINDACEAAINAGALNGKIVVMRRNNCNFGHKVLNAQNSGAVAVIVVNNRAGTPPVMGGIYPSITIPSMMISQADGEPLIAALQAATAVSGRLIGSGTTGIDIDGDFDNGVIAHEYAHGISNRLTGGRANTGCLGNAEQMGEGWSDFFGLMLTIELGDTRTDRRGIGTFVRDADPLSTGIRNAPYSTDFAINDYTYADSNDTASVSQPHGVGFVWCTMLWEMTWDLIDQYGFDPDVYYGTGGNNKAIELVMEGLKLQPCQPGFVDGRDAILAADLAINGGANHCLIWEAFALRGLGASASQGSSLSRTDGVEAFDVPSAVGSPVLDTVDILCVGGGTQVLGGGVPVGGVYSGLGITDDGNGTSYTFDPSVNGVGSVLVSYERNNLCSNTPEVATDTIIIDDDSPTILCPDEINTCDPIINFQFPEPSDNTCFTRTSYRMSQNTDESFGGAIDVQDDVSGHLRRFNLTTEGVLKDYLVTGIDVRINATTGANITVNLYLDTSIDNDITTYLVPISTDVTPYASVVSAVPSGNVFIHTVPMDVFLPAGTAFTVEVISPADQDFMIGYNNSMVLNMPNSTAPSYTSATAFPYQDLIAFDLGQWSALIQVQGTESNSLTTTQTAGFAPGETYPFGTTTNTFQTTDGVTTVSCSFDVNVLGNSETTFTGGAWSNGAPTANTVAKFEESYDTSAVGNSSIDACSCEITGGATLSVAAEDYLKVATDILVDTGSTLNVANTGSVVQTVDEGIATNNGTITVEKITPALAEKSFMISGSPMTGETREGVFGLGYIVRHHITANFVPNPAIEFVPLGINNWADDNGNNWLTHTGGLNPGEGYMVFPQPNGTSSGTYTQNHTLGTLNNGIVNVPLVFNTPGTPLENQNASPNILANPYASAIDVEEFFDNPANDGIDVVYFWEHNTPLSITYPGYNEANFSMSDISLYAEAVGAGVGSGSGAMSGGTVPTRYIASGQGFGVKPTAGGLVQFNNAMRVTGPNDNYRSNDIVERDRLWINVYNDTYGLGSTALIGFTETTSDSFINSEDVHRLPTPVSLYSELDSGEELVVNALGTFETEDAFYLSFSTQVKETQDYRISIDNLDGVNMEVASVYLIDSFTGSVTNLTEGDYSFQSNEATDSKRFKVVFEYSALGINDSNLDSVSLYPNPTQNLVTIVSPQAIVTSATVYDIRGRKVSEVDFSNQEAYQVDLSKVEAALYFVEIITENGIITKRVVKR